MGSLLEKYGKGEDLTAAPVDATSVYPGHPCVAQFTEDGMWYRAKVVKFVEEDKVEVNIYHCNTRLTTHSIVSPVSSKGRNIIFLRGGGFD